MDGRGPPADRAAALPCVSPAKPAFRPPSPTYRRSAGAWKAGLTFRNLRRSQLQGDLSRAVLPEREQNIVYLRFFEGLTQSEIAERVGISQMHVSRLLSRSLETLGEHASAVAET